MAQMLTEEEFREWRGMLESVFESATERARRDRIKKNRARYEGDLWTLLNFSASTPPNIMALNIKNLIARVYMQRPDVDVMPMSPTFIDAEGLLRDNEVACRVMEKVLEWWYAETEQHREDMRSIFNCILTGVGIQAVGYDSQFVYSENLDPGAFTFGHTTASKRHFHVFRLGRTGYGRTTHDEGHSHVIEDGDIQPEDKHTHEIEQVYDPMAAKDAWKMFRDLHFPEEKDPVLQWNETIRRERPWARDVEPEDFIVDPMAFGARLETARWAGYKQWIPERDVKENPLFRNTADLHATKSWSELVPGEDDLFFESSLQPGPATGPEQFVEVWTIFIKHDPTRTGRRDRDNKVLICSLDHDKPFYYGDNPYADCLDGLPFKILHWNEPAGRKFYPQDDITLYAALFEDWLEIREFVARQAKRDTSSVYLVNEESSVGGASLADQIEVAEDGDVIQVQGDPDRAVKLLPKTEVSQSLLSEKDTRRNEIREFSRENELLSGGPLPTKRTATEITEMQAGAASVLELDRFEIQDFLSGKLRMVAQLVRKFFSEPKAFRIIGPDGDYEWLTFDPDEVQGEYNTRIVVNSTTPLNRQVKLEQLMQAFPLIGNVLTVFPDVAASIGQEGIQELLRSMLSMLELDNVNKIIGRGNGAPIAMNPQNQPFPMAETQGGSTAPQQGLPQNSIPTTPAVGQGATL